MCGWRVGYIKGNMEIKVERRAGKVGKKRYKSERKKAH